MTRNLLVAIATAVIALLLVLGGLSLRRDEDRRAPRAVPVSESPEELGDEGREEPTEPAEPISTTAPSEIPSSAADRIDLAEGAGGIAGAVRGPDGEPRGGAEVTLYRVALPASLEASGGLTLWQMVENGPEGTRFREEIRRSLAARARVVSGDAGEFRFEGLPRGRYLVASVDEGMLRSPSISVAYVEGETRKVDVALALAGEMAGVVITPGGDPLPDAVVRLEGVLATPEGGFEAMFVAPSELFLFLLNPIFLVQETAEDGSFRFPRLPGIDYRLQVEASPWAAEPVVSAAVPDVVIEVEEGALLSGTVVNGNGRGISGARVTFAESRDAREMMLMPLRRWGRDREGVETDADGHFRIEGLLPRRYTLRAAAPGFLRSGEQTISAEVGGGAPLLFTLEPGAVIEGKVQGPAGEAVAGARVLATSAEGGRRRGRFGGGTDAESDGGGRFRFDTLQPGVYSLRVEHDGYAPVTRETATGESPLLVTLSRGASMRGRLVRSDGGPIAEAAVSINLPGRFRSLSERSDSQGRFSFTGLPAAERLELEARAAGFSRLRIEVDTSVEDLGELVLDTAPRIRGWVVGPEGGALGGARVQAIPASDDSEGRRRRGRWSGSSSGWSDEAGEFELVLPEPGGRWDVSANFPGLLAVTAEGLTLTGVSYDGLELRLRRGATVAGTVVSDLGAPVADAAISLQRIGEGGRRGGWGRSAGGWSRSGPDGSFLVSGLEAGRYRISASAKGFARARAVDLELFGEEYSRQTIVLEPERVLRGEVLDVAGRGIGGARIRVSARGVRETGVSEPDGRFEVGRIGSEPVAIRVQAGGFQGWELRDVTVESEPITIVLEKSYELCGLVYDSVTGEPVPRARVVAVLEEAQAESSAGERRRVARRTARTDDDGTFCVTGLALGSWRIEVQSRRHQPLSLEGVRVTETPVDDLELALQPGGEIAGRVLDERGRGIADARIEARRTEPGETEGGGRSNALVETARSDEDGRFLLAGLPTATYRLRIAHDEYLTAVVEGVEVVVGSPRPPITRRLEEGGEVRGRVYSSGRSVSDGWVRIAGGDPTVRRQQLLQEGGSFRLAGLTPGAYVLEYRRERRGDPLVTVELSLEGAETRQVDLRHDP